MKARSIEVLSPTEDLMKVAMKSIGDGIIMTDPQGNITFMNSKAEELLCVTFEEAKQKPFDDYFRIYNHRRDAFEDRILEHVFETRKSRGLSRDHRLLNNADAFMFISANIAPIYTEDGLNSGSVTVFRDITKIRNVEDELRKYSSVFKQNPDMIIITDRYWKIEYVNHRFAAFRGISHEDAFGRDVNEILMVNTLIDYKEVEEIVKTLGQWRKEVSYVNDEGDLIVVAININGIKNEDDVLTSYVIVKTDITHRKEAERLLELERENFASIFYGAPMGMVTVDENSMITRINDEASAIFHREKSEMLNKRLGLGLACNASLKGEIKQCGNTEFCSDCIFKSSIDTALNLNRSVRGLEFKHVFYNGNENGRELWIRLSAVPIVVNKKRFAMIVIEDITNNKEMEKNLIENEKRLRLITDNMIDLIIQIDLKGMVQYVSPSVWHLLGYNPETVVNHSMFDFIHPDDREQAKENLRKRLVTQSNFTVEIRIERRDQNYAWLEATGNILKDENNRTSIVYVCRDVTEKRRAINAIKKAKEEAVAANKAKSEFLANMSHEIRTPMNGIIGMTNMTLMTNVTEEQRENLKMVKNSAESLLRIINSILDFSKIEAGKISMDVIDFEPIPMMHKVYKSFHHLAVEKGIDLNIKTDQHLPRLLRGDPSRIVQVMNNLVANAIKFTEQGEITLMADVVEETDAHYNIKFSVNDTGIGIDERDYDKIFKSFSQVDGSITRKYGGTGLGLSITKQLVEMMGGEITFSSKKNLGSEFTFTLPLEYSMKKQVDAINTNLQIPATNQRAEILLVEDDRINQILAKRLLEKQGHQVVIAGNGKEALNELENKGFDLILMDIQMPEMDGIEATLKIKSNSDTKHIPIVALTAYAIKGDQERFLSLGMDDYISKPIDIKKFFNVVDKYVGTKSEKVVKLNKQVDAIIGQIKERNTSKSVLSDEERILFIKDLERYKDNLKKYISEKDYSNIEKTAHFIKNIAGTGNFLELRKKAFRIEIMSRNEKLNEIKSKFEELEGCLKQIRGE